MSRGLPGGENGFRTPGCLQGGTCSLSLWGHYLLLSRLVSYPISQTQSLWAPFAQHPNGAVTLENNRENCHLILWSSAGLESLNLACCELLWYGTGPCWLSSIVPYFYKCLYPYDPPPTPHFSASFWHFWLFDTGSSHMSQTGCAAPALAPHLSLWDYRHSLLNCP